MIVFAANADQDQAEQKYAVCSLIYTVHYVNPFPNNKF